MPTLTMPPPDPAILARRQAIVERLQVALPGDTVIAAAEETLAYECDAFSAYACPPLAVVLPRSTEEVAAALKICHTEGVPVIPRGSGTSLTGGVLPTADSVVISVSRLIRIHEIDYQNRFIRVGSGVTNLSVTGQVEQEGFFYAPDPSSQLACAIAGNIGTNAGGAHCLKYGVTSNNLMGVKMVLADGEIIELGGAHLDSPGYDLLGLICGSEGQMGIVTEATLRILHKPEGARPVLMGFDDPVAAGACVSDIIRAGILPVAIEFMDSFSIRACEEFAQAGYPVECAALLIVEVEGSEQEISDQLAAIKAVAGRHSPRVVRESRSEDESVRIWAGRKAAFSALGRIADYICMDGTIPTDALAGVLKRMSEMARSYNLRVANVFHAGDGNLHPLVLYDANVPGELERAEALCNDILTLCVEVGGCLTGEHGVGVEKRELMGVQFSPEDMEIQMRIKDVFDPGWLLNPAKVFPLSLSESRRKGNSTGQAA